ncbi:MAG: SRPBCC family protein [Thaumarchaeota archaeon]|nr:SRPBCC family protein [Nitrososphaerota archaeon]
MPKVEGRFLVNAAPQVVWEVLTDPHYVPKLYPDLLNIVIEPEGRAVVGQRRTAAGKIGRRLIELRTEVSELVPLKRFALVGRRGGALEEFSEVIELSGLAGGTKIDAVFIFKISEAYFGPDFDMLALTKAAATNQETYLKNLKDLSELRSLE